MRVLRFDAGEKWDDPNARWGDPSMVLEPGDPGYTPQEPSSPPPEPPTYQRKTMSSNATPKSRTVLLSLAADIRAGQTTHGASVGLHHHTAATMDAAILKLVGDASAPDGSDANKGSQLVYRDCVDATGDAEQALKALSDGAVKAWLEGYKMVMTGIHGNKASAGWVAAGFPQGKTAVPRKHEDRLVMLGAARAYLAAHADYEVTLPQGTGAALEITAAAALALKTEMQAARTLVDTRESEQSGCKAIRDADGKALFKEVSETISELRDLLEPTDVRWELFGLNIPANPNPPTGVAELTVTTAGTGRELVAWSYAKRAEYYRLFLRRVGTDPEAVNVADPKDLEHTLKDLTAGEMIEVYVVPMNDGGAGTASPTVTKEVGA